MLDKLPMISGVHFEETPERLKIVLPVRRHWFYLTLYTILMAVWGVMMVWGLIYSVQILFSDVNRRFVFFGMILALLAILFLFGRFLSRQWAVYFSNREILFINKEELIVRRPISMWGNTDVYDMQYVTPVYLDDQRSSATFNYGYRHIHVGEGLSGDARKALVDFLNEVFFDNRVGN